MTAPTNETELKSRNSLTGRGEMRNYVSDTMSLRCLWITETEIHHDTNLTAQEKGLSKSGTTTYN